MTTKRRNTAEGNGAETVESVAVTQPTEVWALATLHLARMNTEILRSLYNLIATEGTSTEFTEIILGRLKHEVDRSADAESAAWQLFIDGSSHSPVQRDTMLGMGPPHLISFEPKHGVPFMGWRAVSDSNIEAKWRRYPVEDLESGARANLTAPFRPVEISKLPPGTVKLAVQDTRHAATIALDEVMQTALADLHDGLEGEDPLMTWGRLRAQVSFHTTVVQKWVKELRIDEYKDWLPQIPHRIRIQDAPSAIARFSTTTVTMQIMTLRTVADFYKDSMDRAERQYPGDTAAMVASVIEDVTAASKNIASIADAMNRLLISSEPKADNMDKEVIFRTIPRGLPIIALIPREFEDTNNKVTKLTPRSA